MKNKKERNKLLGKIIKIITLIIIILLLLHNCVSMYKGRHTNPGEIDIDCRDNKCDSFLKALTVSPKNIDFNSEQYIYNIDVESSVDEIIINAMPFDTSTKVSIPSDLTLKEGLNTFKIVVTAKSGKTKIYIINVTKKPSDNKIVNDIKVSPKDIAFKEDTYTYNINVDNSVDKINIEAFPASSKTKVSIPSNLSLKEGLNIFKIKFTTEDNKEITYTINVTRNKKSSNNNNNNNNNNDNKENTVTKVMKELTTSPINISFNEDVYTYDIVVEKDVNEVIINAMPFLSSTKVIIPSDLTLKEGLNTFEIKAITEDGRELTYTINVTKKGIDKKVIQDITIGPNDIDFNEDTYSYDLEVEEDVDKITLDTLPFDEETSIVITPNNLSLKEGLNTFKIEATNKDGVKKVYTINVNKLGSTKVLKDINVGPLNIDFNENTYSYDLELENNVNEITLDTIAFATDTSVIITPSDLSLHDGLNTFKIEATNKRGIKKVYTINVNRKEPEKKELIIRDKKIRWTQTTAADIFENKLYDRGKIIAPESKNTYQFELTNKTDYKLKYEIEFLETNPYNINMKYKLKKNDTYIISDYVSASELNQANIVIDVNTTDTYYLEWHWISSTNDTEIGKNKDSFYDLKINIKAESING